MAEALLSKTPLYCLKDTVTVILNMGAARAGSLVQLPEGHEFLLVSPMGVLKGGIQGADVGARLAFISAQSCMAAAFCSCSWAPLPSGFYGQWEKNNNYFTDRNFRETPVISWRYHALETGTAGIKDACGGRK